MVAKLRLLEELCTTFIKDLYQVFGSLVKVFSNENYLKIKTAW